MLHSTSPLNRIGDDDDDDRLQVLPCSNLNLVHEAMAFAGDATAYHKAMEVCPNLVLMESPHDRYLEKCQGNMWKAAERLASYWKLRAEVLGDQAAFRPISEAFSKDEWDHLMRQGNPVILPPDATGRPIYFVDRERFESGGTNGQTVRTQMRALWFIYHLVCHSSIYANQDEFVILFRVDINRFSYKHMDREMAELMRRMSTGAMSGGRRIERIHFLFICNNSQRDEGRYMQSAMVKAVENIASWAVRLPTEAHLGSTKEILRSLAKHGIWSSGLPACCGGSWSLETDWPAQLERLTGRSVALQEEQVPESRAGRPLFSTNFDMQQCDRSSNALHAFGKNTGWHDAQVGTPFPAAVSFALHRDETTPMVRRSTPLESQVITKKPRMQQGNSGIFIGADRHSLQFNAKEQLLSSAATIFPLPNKPNHGRGTGNSAQPFDERRTPQLSNSEQSQLSASASFPAAKPTFGQRCGYSSRRASVGASALAEQPCQLELKPVGATNRNYNIQNQSMDENCGVSASCDPSTPAMPCHVRSRPISPPREPEPPSPQCVPSLDNATSSFSGDLVHEAMAFAANNDAYLQAVQVCPDVIEAESPHGRYLQYCVGNMWSAAQRLACYWELRLEVFGQRAFLPLKDALTPEDWMFYKKSHRVILPPDSQGRPVALLDRVLLHSNIVRATPLDVRLRITFLFLQQCCDSAPTGKIVCMVRVDTSRLSALRYDRQITDLTRRLFCTAMCGNYDRMDFVIVDPPKIGHSHGMVITLLFNIVQRTSLYMAGLPSFWHMGNRQEVQASLKDHGFLLEHLAIPEIGTYNSETEWPSWIDRQDLTRGAFRLDVSNERSSMTAQIPCKAYGKRTPPPAEDWCPPVMFGSEEAAEHMFCQSVPSSGKIGVPATLAKQVVAVSPKPSLPRPSQQESTPIHVPDAERRKRNLSLARTHEPRSAAANNEVAKRDDDICRSVEYTMEARREKRRLQNLKDKKRKRERLAKLKERSDATRGSRA